MVLNQHDLKFLEALLEAHSSANNIGGLMLITLRTARGLFSKLEYSVEDTTAVRAGLDRLINALESTDDESSEVIQIHD